MAAIIAQITRAKRERDKKKTYQTEKCMYHLPPFDPHFEPMVHNKFLARLPKIFILSIKTIIITATKSIFFILVKHLRMNYSLIEH